MLRAPLSPERMLSPNALTKMHGGRKFEGSSCKSCKLSKFLQRSRYQSSTPRQHGGSGNVTTKIQSWVLLPVPKLVFPAGAATHTRRARSESSFGSNDSNHSAFANATATGPANVERTFPLQAPAQAPAPSLSQQVAAKLAALLAANLTHLRWPSLFFSQHATSFPKS